MRMVRLGLLILGVTVVSAIVAGAVLRELANGPDDIIVNVAITQPAIAANDLFTLTVTIHNIADEPITLTRITLDNDLLLGVSVQGSDPPSRRPLERSYPLIGDWVEYPFEREVAGGDMLAIRFTMQATTPGNYSGDVGAWIESDLLGLKTARARYTGLAFRIDQGAD